MTKKQQLIQQLISGVLFVAVLAMLGWLSVRYNAELDWTAGQRNTLTEASKQQLAAMPGPIVLRAFAYSGEGQRALIEGDLRKYLREKADIELQFIDPSAEPQKVREFNISAPGEIVIEYQGRRETVRATTEPVVTTALQRLAYGGEQWVVFLEGHGERSINDAQSQSAYTGFAQALRDKGLKVRSLSLVSEPSIPDNTGVLVIASPETRLLEGEIALINTYVENGGNLLWLADPDFAPGLAPVAKTLGITWQNGYAILPEYELLGTGHPGFFAALGYPPNPVTTGFDQVTLFPLVRSVIAEPVEGWQAQTLLETSESAWLETGDIASGRVELDERDIKGPLSIGLTLTRERREGEGEDAKSVTQRVALIGDADFLANAYLGEFGNQLLGLNLVQWLASRDAQLNIDVPKAPDTSLYLPGWAMLLISGGFVIALPLLLLGVGVGRWMLRRRR